MKAGKYVGIEVCGGFSLDECWQLVNTHEETGAHLMFLENVCYRRDVMAVTANGPRRPVWRTHAPRRRLSARPARREVQRRRFALQRRRRIWRKGFSEAKWRTKHSVHRNGDLYPTHGVGPVAMMTNINRGNRFLYPSPPRQQGARPARIHRESPQRRPRSPQRKSACSTSATWSPPS
jgi:hypothetical protein